jgi:hypothetical protein
MPRRPSVQGILRVAFAVAVASSVGACSAASPSFSTSGPCLVDGRAPGAYPQLEALVPRTISGRPATTVDSGRNCTSTALGSFTSHEVGEIDYAGATWDEGGGNGVSIAVLAAPSGALPAAWAEEFYLNGAEASSKTANIETSRPTYPGAGTVYRLDTLNDLSYQSVVVWPDGPVVRVVLVATQVGPAASKSVHDARVSEAVGAAVLASEAAAGSPAASPGSPAGSPGGGGPGASEPVLPSAS